MLMTASNIHGHIVGIIRMPMNFSTDPKLVRDKLYAA
jgi:hypothetical protein